jgi:glycosyltransferase involved in cell wall biosynthesis
MVKRRIVFLFNSFVRISGGDVRLVEIAKRIGGFEKTVITCQGGKDMCCQRGLNANYLITTNRKEIYLKKIFLVYLARIMKALVLKNKICDRDVLYSSSDFLTDVFPALFYKSARKHVRWVQIIHHVIPSPLKRRGIFLTNLISHYSQKLSFFFIKHFADLIIVVNSAVAEELRRESFDEELIKTSSNGVHLRYLENVKPDVEKAYECAFLGRLHSSKGIFDLIDIWSEVSKEKNDSTLAIIGMGDERTKTKLKEKIRQNSMNRNIDVLVNLNDEKAFRILKSCKVYAFPSYEEGWGISVCEAMACGLPVVAYDLAAYRVFEDAVTKVTIGDKRAFSKELIRLLSDEQLTKELSEKAHKIASQFDWDLVAKRELSLLERLIES